MSVPSQADVQATFCATLVDEWVRAGILDVVIGPGSRSTPLALACARRPELRCHVRIDERSAAFFAIGRSLDSGVATVLVVTSGTAAAELHAAVCEADQAGVALIVATADRPPRLHGVGAPQTIDQDQLFGGAVRLFEDAGVPEWAQRDQWRSLANRVAVAAHGGTHAPGPVQLNLPFEEPLIGQPLELPEGRSEQRPWQALVAPHSVAARVDLRGRRVLAVVGQGVSSSTIDAARELGWAVIGDATVANTIAYADPIVRCDAVATRLRPDVVVRLGGLPASKVVMQRVAEWQCPVIGFDGSGFLSDPDHLISERVAGNPTSSDTALRGDESYATSWERASAIVNTFMDSFTEHSEIALAALVTRVANEHDVALVVGSSMPVRDVEWFGPARRTRVFSNRGVNGIDGVVSTVFGVGAVTSSIGYVGDVTMLHDVSALVEGVGPHGGRSVLVVSDNSGGGIFSFLSQGRELDHDEFEHLFGTPRSHDLVAVARAFGHAAESVSNVGEARGAIEAGLSRDGVSVVVVELPDRRTNVATHEAVNEQISALLEGSEF